VRSAEPDNPFRTARVGDWTVYKLVAKGKENEVLMSQKLTLIARDDKEATVEVIRVFVGTELPPTTFKVDLSKPYDPVQQPINPDPAKVDLKIEQLDAGKETLQIGDKKYECTWRKVKLTGKQKDKDVSTEAKVWVSKDAPLTGLVRVDFKAKEGEGTMTLEEHGRRK
jgi:hypothetical protein